MAKDLSSTLLYGKIGANLPPVRSRVVRIFTSSTFTDTSVERNALMQDVYPKLKDYCKSKYGLQFQVVDMRWGVRDEATDDHMTTQLCMNEIAGCQKVSMGPNFVTFLCQKYGYRPFPPKIPANELDAMRRVLVSENKSVELLDTWFQRDDNAVPSVYILQPISSILVHFNNNENPDQMANDRRKWWDVFEALQQQLRHASRVCLKQKTMNEKNAAKFNISVTHDEVIHGILDVKENREDHCVCFVRKFQGLEQKIDNKEAKQFIDIDEDNNTIDVNAQQLLTDLRDKQMVSYLKPPNLVVSTLSNWSENGIDLNIPEHKQYLEQFLKRFYDMIVSLVDRGVERDKANISNHPMYEEILQHLTFAKFKCQSFHGRGDLLSSISAYIKERVAGNPATASPMVVYGESGSGKTSVMAKAAQLAGTQWCPQSVVVLRFLGTTPASTGVRQLLKSACLQILAVFGHTNTGIPDDYFQVVRWFSQVLQYATAKKPMLIFLDSLDQLSAGESAHRMAWLPRYLPPHVAIIVSTLPKTHNILNTLRYFLPNGMAQYSEVKQLSVEEGLTIIKSWLQSERRAINNEQQGIITSSIQQCSLPLFLKLLFDQASKWQSYLPSSQIKVQPSVKGMISIIFDRLEEYHGKVLVSHALSYMTISQNGIGEAELEDLLSLDDEVLQDVYAYWLPPTRRIPPLLWTRIRAEINDYLVEREAEGSRVIYWYHRQFIEAATERYLQNPQHVAYLHRKCSDYFMGKWSGGVKKPFEYTDAQVKKFNRPKKDEADRKVAPQPLVFGTAGSHFNIRKLEQLPYHLIHAGDADVLKQHTLCNFSFLISKILGMNVGEVLQDFTLAITKYEKDEDMRLVSDTIRMGVSAIRDNPHMLTFELVGRLSISDRPHIARLCAQAQKETTNQIPLVPYNQCYPHVGGLLRTQLTGHTDEVLCIATTSDGRYLVSGSRDKTAIVWELESCTIKHNLKDRHKSAIADVLITPDDLLVITYCFKARDRGERKSAPDINVWNLETGEHFLSLINHTGYGNIEMRVTPDIKFIVAEMYVLEEARDHYEVHGHYFKTWSLENGRELYPPVEAHKSYLNDLVIARSNIGRPLIVTCGREEDPVINIWDLFTGKFLTQVLDRRKLRHQACTQMAVSSNGRYVAFHFSYLGILDVHTAQFTYISDIEIKSVFFIRFLNNDSQVLFQDQVDDSSLIIYSVEDKKEANRVKFSISGRGQIQDVHFTEDWKTIVTRNAKNEYISVWRAPQGNEKSYQFQAKLPHQSRVTKVCFLEVPTLLAITASKDKNIKVWNLSNLSRPGATQGDMEEKQAITATFADKRPMMVRNVKRFQVLNQEQLVAIIDNNGDNIILYDAVKGKEINKKTWTGKDLGGLASSWDGKRLYAIGGCDLMEYDSTTIETVASKKLEADCCGIMVYGDGSLTVLLGGTGYVENMYIYDINKGWYLKEYKTSCDMQSIYLLPGYRLLFCQSTCFTMVDLRTGNDIYKIEFSAPFTIYCVKGTAVTKDGRIIISRWGDGCIKLHNLDNGAEIRSVIFHDIDSVKTDEDFTKIEISSRDQFFVTGSAVDKDLRLWDVATLRLIHILGGHTNTVNNFKITADDLYVLTAQKKEIYVKIWSVNTGQLLSTINGYSPISSINIIARGNRVVIITADDRVMFFQVNPEVVRRQAMQQHQLPPPAMRPGQKQPQRLQQMRQQPGQMHPQHTQQQSATSKIENEISSMCIVL
ncbi:NACHT domain- and WD repeat-containing protein 1-like [Saccoglossus kowalevskii]